AARPNGRASRSNWSSGRPTHSPRTPTRFEAGSRRSGRGGTAPASTSLNRFTGAQGGTMTKAITPEFRTVDGLRIRYAEGGSGPRAAVLLSPWPESVFAFEQVWPLLSE